LSSLDDPTSFDPSHRLTLVDFCPKLFCILDKRVIKHTPSDTGLGRPGTREPVFYPAPANIAERDPLQMSRRQRGDFCGHAKLIEHLPTARIKTISADFFSGEDRPIDQ
jgi:hypothetical protein